MRENNKIKIAQKINGAKQIGQKWKDEKSFGKQRCKRVKHMENHKRLYIILFGCIGRRRRQTVQKDPIPTASISHLSNTR